MICKCEHHRANHMGMGPSRGKPIMSACCILGCDCIQWRPKRNRDEVHAFCRELLKQTMKEVRQHFTAEEIKGAWVYDAGGRKEYEFHGANKEYMYGLDADCTWSAKAAGWSKMLRAKLEGRKAAL